MCKYKMSGVWYEMEEPKTLEDLKRLVWLSNTEGKRNDYATAYAESKQVLTACLEKSGKANHIRVEEGLAKLSYDKKGTYIMSAVLVK